ncbi:helix-turn-helix domain-containing protein [Spirosoma telluris]|uniref:helix-turn-helix domain-containing protein n=1 Tax=Spirosoma telluris TaxID=2183553 RepID=UPI0038CD65C8
MGQHFFDYINRHRIEEAKRLFRQSTDAKLTVLEVLYQVGFNSKSSFNTLFRKYTGQTPTDYKNQTKPV